MLNSNYNSNYSRIINENLNLESGQNRTDKIHEGNIYREIESNATVLSIFISSKIWYFGAIKRAILQTFIYKTILTYILKINLIQFLIDLDI